MGRALQPLLILLALAQMSDCPRVTRSLTLLNADVKKYAPFIIKALYHDNVAGTNLSALSETEKPINGDSWYWTDDNAKSLEALTLAPVFPQFTTQAGKIVQFIIANSPPPFVFRRRADERLEVKSDNPNDFRVATGLMNFHGNLSQADIRHGYRFHDDRTEDAVKYSGDFLRFSHRGRIFNVEVNKNTATQIQRDMHRTVLVHATDLKADSAVVGRVAYTYTIEANMPYVGLTVAVSAAPSVTLSDVTVTTSLDQLDSVSGIRYSKFYSYRKSGPPVSIKANNEATTRTLLEGPSQWWTLIQDGDLGFSYAVTTLVDSPDRLRSITSTAEQGGHFHHVRANYAIDAVSPGQTVTVSEKKLVLAGGLYNAMGSYASVFERLDSYPGLDLSISYDIGAELNGVASAYLADKRRVSGNPNLAPIVYTPETRKWIDDILEAYIAKFPVKVDGEYPYIFTRGHSFVVLALDAMVAATGDGRYLERLRHMADVLTELQVKKGPLTDNFICVHHSFFLDCHASAMIALARAAATTGNRRYAESVRRGLNAYHVNPQADTGQDVFFRQRDHAKEGDSYYWIFKAGLLLRSLEGLEVLAERNLLRLSPSEWSFLRELQDRSVSYLSRAAHSRGNLDELLTCHKAGETNSETQAWALLGLYPIEHERSEGRAP